MKLLYIMLIIPVIQYAIFRYYPMYGAIIAFKDYKYSLGILASPWNNFAHFKTLFNDPYFLRILKNTLSISILRIVVGFPTPIILALFLNEIKNLKFKKITQSITYLPHFLSWVVISSIMMEILSPTRGIVNYIITLFGGETIQFLASKQYFVGVLIITALWKEVGWGSIIYLAAISGISYELYEASEIDGANRFQKAVHITIPSIYPIITLSIILSFSGLLNAGFEQIFNLYNPTVYEVADIIDTYVFRVGFFDNRYDFASAVGLFQSVVGLTFVLLTNYIARKHSNYTLW